ncbi:unnamed protein product [Urochloa humidicola]
MRSASIDTAAVPVPWAELPPELCGLVMDRLDAFSVLRFPAVCKSWAAAFHSTPRGLRSGAPTLLTSCPLHASTVSTTFALHDVSSGGKTFHAEADALKKRWWVGGKDDWLVTTDSKCNVELLNPATGDVVRLPSFATIPGATLEGLTLCVAPRTKHLFEKVALCRTPAHRDGYLAIAMFSDSYFLAFAAAGDERWTALKNNLHAKAYENAIVHEGKIFAVDFRGNVSSWNMDGGGANDPPSVVRAPEIQTSRFALRRRFNLAPSTRGQLLLVCMYVERRFVSTVKYVAGGTKKPHVHMELELPSSHGARCISLHELDVGSGAWRHVDDLGGDRALFVGGTSYPFYATVVPHECSHLKANNAVYAADLYGCPAVVFDLDQGCADSCGPRVPHDSIISLRKPMWFRPTTHSEKRAVLWPHLEPV